MDLWHSSTITTSNSSIGRCGRYTASTVALGGRSNDERSSTSGSSSSSPLMIDHTRWIVETKDLAEIDAVQVTVGDPAQVKLDAFPGEVFAGQVTELDPVGREYLGDMTYTVTITLDEFDPRFLWNMTATVTVETE